MHTIFVLQITFDPAKSEQNARLRSLPFERAAAFDFDGALYAVDERKSYAEVRIIAIGGLGDRLHVLCFTETEDGIRVISFRKANAREVRRYVQAQAPTVDPV